MKQSGLRTTTTFSSMTDLFLSISLPGERWKQIKGFTSNYFVSDMGRLLTLTHHGGRHPSIIRPAKDANGYYRTVLNGKTVKVHRIVAENWLLNPLGLPCVNHIDSNRGNNRVENLEWCSVKYNAWYGVHHGSIKVSRHPRQNLVPETVRRSVVAEAKKFLSLAPRDRRGRPAPARGCGLESLYARLTKTYPELARVKFRTMRSWMQGRKCPSQFTRQSLTSPSVSERHHTHIVSEDGIVFQCTTPERPTSRARRSRTSGCPRSSYVRRSPSPSGGA